MFLQTDVHKYLFYNLDILMSPAVTVSGVPPANIICSFEAKRRGANFIQLRVHITACST
jgi:hypothetical protein